MSFFKPANSTKSRTFPRLRACLANIYDSLERGCISFPVILASIKNLLHKITSFDIRIIYRYVIYLIHTIFLRDFKHCLITIFQSTDINRPAQSAVPAQCCERGSPSSRHFLLQHVTRRSLNLCLRYTSVCLIKHTSRTRWCI